MRESNHGVKNQQHSASLSPWDRAKKWVSDEERALTDLDSQNTGTMQDIQRKFRKAKAKARLRGVSAVILFLCYVFVNVKLLLFNGFATSFNYALVIPLMAVYLFAVLLGCIVLLCKAKIHFRTYFDRLLLILWIGSLIELGLYVGVTLDLMYIVLILAVFLSFILYLASGRFLAKVRAVGSFLFTVITLILVGVVVNGFVPMSMQYIVDTPAWERHSVYYEDNGDAVLSGVMLNAKDIFCEALKKSGTTSYEIPSQVQDGDIVYDVVAVEKDAMKKCVSCSTVVFPSTLQRVEQWSFGDSVDTVVFKINAPSITVTNMSVWDTLDKKMNVEMHLEKGIECQIVMSEDYQISSNFRFVVDESDLGYYRSENPEISDLFVVASSVD